MFIDQDDYDYLLETNAEFKAAAMVSLAFPDLPGGLKRYILCSQKVGEGVMAKINAVIETEGMRCCQQSWQAPRWDLTWMVGRLGILQGVIFCGKKLELLKRGAGWAGRSSADMG